MKRNMEELDPILRRELREAYMEGKSGKPCSIYHPLTVQTSPEEIKQAADALPVVPDVPQRIESATRALYRAYMSAWQVGRSNRDESTSQH